MAKRRQPERRISIRSIRRDPPDLQKLGRALIALAMAQAEAEAQAQHEAEKAEEQPTEPRSDKSSGGTSRADPEGES